MFCLNTRINLKKYNENITLPSMTESNQVSYINKAYALFTYTLNPIYATVVVCLALTVC
jgi:hypothetical protein